MTLIRKNAVVERHRKFAKEKELSFMGDRSRKRTDFLNKEISIIINPQPGDIVIDIGCGDASLLALFSRKVKMCYGTASTDEEIERLKQEYINNKKMEFFKWFDQPLPFKDSSATKIVCNAVLFYFEKQKASEILKEINRVSKKSAVIFIGEIPDVDESDHTEHGDSILEVGINKLRKGKLVDFIRFSWRILKAIFTDYLFYLMPKGALVLKPDEFIDLATKSGLTISYYKKHIDMRESGEIFESPTRWDYILLKP